MPVSITASAVEVRYGDRLALRVPELALQAPASVAVIGPNGSGKSTLLRAIAGLIDVDTGSIAASAACALVLQSTDVDRSLPITVRDTVWMARYPRLGLLGRPSATDRRAVDDAMARLDVADLADRQLHELSGGQRQRVLVAQGLAQEAEVLLLDEPITGLDLVSRTRILDVVDAERDAERLVVMTTHNLEDARRCDVVLLLDTEPIACGAPDDVLTDGHLQRAFGGRFVRLGDDVLLDDPHHDHGHDHH